MSRIDPQQLILDIYESAAFPERWPGTLERLGRLADTPAVMLLTRREDSWVGCTASDPLRESIEAYVASDVPGRSRTTTRLLAADHAGFLTDRDLFTASDWEQEPFRNEWARHWGWNHASATAIEVPTGDFLVIQAQRKEDEPPFTARDVARLDSFRPHLARAGLLAARWRLQRLTAATEALALVGLPATVLDQAGKAIAANDLMDTVSGHVRWWPNDRLGFRDPSAARSLAPLKDPRGTHASRSVASCPPGAVPAVIHLIPLAGQVRDIFDGGLSLVVITQVGEMTSPSASVLKGLFDLTAAEARVAKALAMGKTVRQIALDFGIGEATVRTHLKSVLAKSSSSRQSEFILQLLGTTRGIPQG